MDAKGYGGGALKLGRDEEVESLRAKLAAAEERVEALEWLLEAERFWFNHPANGSTWWDSIERKHSTSEAKAIWKSALAAAGK